MSSAPPSESGSLAAEDGMPKKKDKKGLKKLASKVRARRLPPVRKSCRAPHHNMHRPVCHQPGVLGWNVHQCAPAGGCSGTNARR